ncbi:L,D-transpeptidase [Sphingomonas sp. GC_Shp_3]|uniref:L,D-transpeptidase n=1 Tax=Sphingomonas sp. GC_Shp_3 TaxID=2937383 RepID=UPI00226A9124|nr:L,D-transpeptidase [Sphingomonas sp. GC_Shp_3]
MLNTIVVSMKLLRIDCHAAVIAAAWLVLAPSPAIPATVAVPATHAKAKPKAAPPAARRAATKRKAVAKPTASVAVPEVVPSEAAARVLAWVAAEHDNGSLPYIVIDKQAATMFLYRADGELVGTAPVLLGIGVGDDSSPGVGAKSLAEIGPAERTTPAGRFVARFGKAFGGTRVLWVDYADSVALHAVITTHKKERRVERLLSPTPDDNRISFGCINVGTSFYTKQVRPLFQKKGGMVYILPDTKPLDDVFPRLRLLPYIATDPRPAATGA